MENAKNDLTKRLKEANNVLVTVSSNPSVDQLAGAIGITLLLNKLKKHATAVFSGDVPSVMEFLEPEKTLEKDTNSLRDFIIALDKAKADKLRYKIEENHVKIFITPYRTSISQDDLEFSQGDFNVDVVLALGVHQRKDLDQAIAAHGRILHDATVASINTQPNSELGSINWVDAKSSSLCEMLVVLSSGLQENGIDEQMATAFLTGIVAETDRFSNQKTSSETMNISSKLMSAGANQQLVATKLEEPQEPTQMDPDKATSFDPADFVDSPPDTSKPQATEKPEDGTLSVAHPNADEKDSSNKPDQTLHEDELADSEPKLNQIHIDQHGTLSNKEEANASPSENQDNGDGQSKPKEENEDHGQLPKPLSEPKNSSKIMTEPPALGGTLTASGKTENENNAYDLLGEGDKKTGRILSHDSSPDDASGEDATKKDNQDEPASVEEPEPTPDTDGAESNQNGPTAATPGQTSSPADNAKPQEPTQESADDSRSQDTRAPQKPGGSASDSGLDSARDAVMQAVSSGTSDRLEPVVALNAQPVNLDLSHDKQDNPNTVTPSDSPGTPAQDNPPEAPPHKYLDVNQIDPSTGLPVGQSANNGNSSNQPESPVNPDHPAPGSTNPNAPPPEVPPPMMPPQL